MFTDRFFQTKVAGEFDATSLTVLSHFFGASSRRSTRRGFRRDFCQAFLESGIDAAAVIDRVRLSAFPSRSARTRPTDLPRVKQLSVRLACSSPG